MLQSSRAPYKNVVTTGHILGTNSPIVTE